MNRVLARRLTLSVPRAGGLTKRVIPGFNTQWEHPSAGTARDHLVNTDEDPSEGNILYFRKYAYGGYAGQMFSILKFYIWSAMFFSIPFLSLGHNNYMRFGSPYKQEE